MKTLEDLMRIAEGATPGPWSTLFKSGDCIFVGHVDQKAIKCGTLVASVDSWELNDCDKPEENAAHIATFNPQLVKAMIEEIVAARMFDTKVESPDYQPLLLASNRVDKSRERLDAILKEMG